MKTQSTNSIIPEGELRCVWMDAGITSFKLCDQEFCCENCAFNTTVTQQQRETPVVQSQSEPQIAMSEQAWTSDMIFTSSLKKRLDQLRTMSIPPDRMYSRGQFWLQQNEEGNYRFGINHILANFFQPILSIVLSKAPASIRRNDPFCWIILPGGAITLRSPIDATIARFNPALQKTPNLLSASPFQDGWIMEVAVKSRGTNNLVSPSDSQRLAKRTLQNIEHIFKQAFQHLQPSGAGTTLFDGGIAVNSLESILGPTIYREIANRITHFS